MLSGVSIEGYFKSIELGVDVADVEEVSEVKEVACLYFLLGAGESLSMLSQWGRFPLRDGMTVRVVGCCR